MPTTKTEIKQYHSLPQLYTGVEQPDLELQLRLHGDDSIEIILINQKYQQQRQSKFKQLFLLVSLYGGYYAMALSNLTVFTYRSCLVDLAFLVWVLYSVLSTCALIKSEKLLFCLDFALQLQTERFWSRRTNIFISASNIHDIVINEVIENLDVHYLLIVRTKGGLFKQQSIIPLFNNLKPSIEAIEMIYKHLKKVVYKNVCADHHGL